MTTNTWNGENMTQEDFMQKDTCILLNNDDQILGNASKYDAHVFSPENVPLSHYLMPSCII